MRGTCAVSEDEWLETDGLGGFASGTVSGVRTRRYHALLLTATKPPTGRVVLVNGIEAWVNTAQGRFALSSQCYGPDVVYPDGRTRIEQFRRSPWPVWTYRLPDGVAIRQEVFAVHGLADTVLRWTHEGSAKPLTLEVRLLLSGRDYHALHHENPSFRFDADVSGHSVTWRPYDGLPGVTAVTNGAYRHDPTWYRNFLYAEEQRRGLDCVEDLASPGVFWWTLDGDEAVLVLRASEGAGTDAAPNAVAYSRTACDQERRRRNAFGTEFDRCADAYIVERGTGRTIVAGYPWFTDWGRDTFIALRGLCLARGRLDMAGAILLGWADTVSEGMLPNRFPDAGKTPEYNSVDASLWYIVAVHDFLVRANGTGFGLDKSLRERLQEATADILAGYAAGTRYGIRMDSDGLLSAGVPGVQLTWMDAKVGDWVVTPRIGKPVEIQALWINALRIGSELESTWTKAWRRAQRSFRDRFWNAECQYLHDVVDVEHQPGITDSSFRPNQILAVGGLPYCVLDKRRAKSVVAEVERRLWTPLGLRSLAIGESAYRGIYEGGPLARDSAYHQGTVWCWLAGPFVEAWLRVHPVGTNTFRRARERFIDPILEHLDSAGLGHVSEIADGDAPHNPRGCPFQAWSLGELLRVLEMVDGTVGAEAPARARRLRVRD